MSITQESITFDEMIRDLLLAMVSSQNEANKNFIAGIEDLAGTDISINYTKHLDGDKKENREIKGNALAFGVLPTLLSIQSGVIEIRTAMSVSKNSTSSGTKSTDKNVKTRAGYLFKADTVDAKYQNTYSYKAESSSIIRITVVPTPPSQALMEAIRVVAEGTKVTDNAAK
ncbi:MAG: hypothetical protein NWF00_00445 [Candidatus Bathyarchaeota archaeon]|nr:hypothetical protein [Candidatus Bathyarchaeota archaeon]